jgi:hypothetical protein
MMMKVYNTFDEGRLSRYKNKLPSLRSSLLLVLKNIIKKGMSFLTRALWYG